MNKEATVKYQSWGGGSFPGRGTLCNVFCWCLFPVGVSRTAEEMEFISASFL